MTPWVTEQEADEYFETRLGADEYWKSGVAKTAALVTAQRDIESCGRWTFEEVSSGAPASETMKTAVFEQALFRLMDQDIDRRQSLQVQGVVSEQNIGESFSGQRGIVISPYAERMLSAYRSESYGTIAWTK